MTPHKRQGGDATGKEGGPRFKSWLLHFGFLFKWTLEFGYRFIFSCAWFKTQEELVAKWLAAWIMLQGSLGSNLMRSKGVFILRSGREEFQLNLNSTDEGIPHRKDTKKEGEELAI